GAGASEDAALYVLERDHALLRVATIVGLPTQGRDSQGQRLGERHALAVVLGEVARDHVARAADHGVLLLVGDLAVVGEPVDLVVLGRVADLGNEDLDLIGLLAAAGADRAQRLRIGRGQATP